MRYIVYGLFILLVAIQYPLWIGKGGWLYVYQLDKEVKVLADSNKELEIRNAKISGDVQDLKQGTKGVEERARLEHGMVKDNEILVKVLKPDESLPQPNKTGK
ncbi:cell division protein FtsB [Polynucleobacter rarus]|uniref:cell division protein FtsB n=1 Tax=Polynucleobacter rarus TaxID=556055 RepID=UPI000D3E22DA|nr:cell division protein FtsB [Polynucleobacter rarus]